MKQKYSVEIKKALKEKGARAVLNGVRLYSEYLYHASFESLKHFEVMGKRFSYYYHPYNATWRNERCVEIPVIWKILQENKGKNILEFGNVLSHYFRISHDVLDKYEKADGVINEEVVEFNSSKKYDLIVSISTLEHVGFDETPKEPLKVLKAVEKLRESLSENGKIYVTLPVGQNLEMDKLINSGQLKLDEQYFLKRVSGSTWKEATFDEIKDSAYNSPFFAANAIRIGVIYK